MTRDACGLTGHKRDCRIACPTVQRFWNHADRFANRLSDELRRQTLKNKKRDVVLPAAAGGDHVAHCVPLPVRGNFDQPVVTSIRRGRASSRRGMTSFRTPS